jgi:hypothetical protein
LQCNPLEPGGFNSVDYGIESTTTAVSPEAVVSTSIESMMLEVSDNVSESVDSEVVLLQEAARRLTTRNKENSLNSAFIKMVLLMDYWFSKYQQDTKKNERR